MEILGIKCIDGGKCHHMCKDKCFRRECCSPFSDYEGEWAYENEHPSPAKELEQVENLDRIKELESIIFDLCNGYHNWWDIHQDTGESDERCKEILEVYNQIKDKYK